MKKLNYRIYEHVIGFPGHMDTIAEELEEMFFEHDYTAEEAENS